MTTVGRRVSGFVVLAGLAAQGGGARADDAAVPASRWVSSEAVIYGEIPHPGVLFDRFQAARLRALVESVPGLKAAFEREDVRKLREAVYLVAERLGKPLDVAARELTGGGVVIAVEAPAKKGQDAGLILIVTPTDPDLLKKASSTLIDLARKDAEAKGQPDPIKSGDHRGVTGYQVGPKAVYAVVSGRLVVADRSDTLKAVVDRSMDGLPEGKTVESLSEWKALKPAAGSDVMKWAFARVARLHELDPKKFSVPEKPDTGATLLFGGWLETLRKAEWLGATATWTDDRLSAVLTMPAPKGGRAEAFKGYFPPKGQGAPALVNPPGTILSASLWRDLSAVWESRTDLLKPEDVQGLAGLDTFAGQFFGGRDFGSGVLGATTSDWRVVVALQDAKALKPVPDVILPAFALVVDLKPDDDDFAQRLKVAFQSFIGLVNIGAAQSKAPPLEMLSESFDGVTIATSRFMPPAPAGKDKDKPKAEDEKPAVNTRHNFTPSAVQVGNHFVIGSSLGLTRDLVKSLKNPGRSPEDGTLVAEADGPTLAKLVDANRTRLVMRNILEKGNGQAQAEGEVDLLASLLRYLGHARLGVKDGADVWRLNLDFKLGK